MKILVACEFSGIVREAFAKRGHDAWSCDLLDTEIPGQHYTGDVRDLLYGCNAQHWDLIIAHPPCTHLAVSGARWFKDRQVEQKKAINFFLDFTYFIYGDPLKVCIENPIGIMSTRYCKPTQIIQPWMFGHGETKATCLWLHNLPKLLPTNIVDGREQRIHHMPPSPDRGKERSRTYQGIADAMAEQWGELD
jgi:hypothetical protein